MKILQDHYPDFSDSQIQTQYLIDIVDKCYPKLFNLLYELGLHYGTWRCSGGVVEHDWRANDASQITEKVGATSGPDSGSGKDKERDFDDRAKLKDGREGNRKKKG